jgi:uncharacterized membrane protein
MTIEKSFLELLLGTVIYRPYVYLFFVCFLVFAVSHLKIRGTLFYILSSYLIAFGSEYSATRNGFPFGVYTYIDHTRTRELWISNIPFWDSLSFVFLSYFSWIVASSIKNPKHPERALFEISTAFLGGFLMMLLDVVIDPLTVLGDKWFLGKIYYYPDGGIYFGVTLSNFVGWFFVGTFTLLFFQKTITWLSRKNKSWKPKSWALLPRYFSWGAIGVYSGVFLFNIAITAWIQEWKLFWTSSTLAFFTLAACVIRAKKR